MDLFLLFCYILIGSIQLSSSRKTTDITLDVDGRVNLLKLEIKNQYKSKVLAEKLPIENSPLNEDVEYIERANDPVTPISENDPRKSKNLFKLKEIKTTRDLGQNFRQDDYATPKRKKHREVFERNAPNEAHGLKPIKKLGRSRMLKKSHITDIFYRRVFSSETAKCWTHCQDLITPFLTGQKTNITHTKRLTYDNAVVLRLLQLLTEDVTEHAKDDINSILYQISNLQLRLFQWDVSAIKLLINSIIRDKTARPKASFTSLKHGLKSIFSSWNLSFGSDISTLLKQARIFRPPCVKITDNEGSTMSSKVVRYTKSVQPKCNGQAGYDDCED